MLKIKSSRDNYEYLSNWVADICGDDRQKKILDYGCGAAQTVELMRAHGYQAFGCDVFYEAFVYNFPGKYFEEGIVRKMKDVIPFEDNFFDIIITNQVMEHVEDLDLVLSEMDRVLKPGGIVFSIFPDQGIWREGHTNIPFLHWFSKKTKFRVYYAAFLHFLGLGARDKKLSHIEWSKSMCKMLDDHTIYRKLSVIYSAYNKYFTNLTHVEETWFDSRFGEKYSFFKIFPNFVLRFIVRKFGGLAFVVKKPS